MLRILPKKVIFMLATVKGDSKEYFDDFLVQVLDISPYVQHGPNNFSETTI